MTKNVLQQDVLDMLFSYLLKRDSYVRELLALNCLAVECLP
jgi:hypothetical protein